MIQTELEEGERIVWEASPRNPRVLRRLGLPPRAPHHLFLHSLAATLLVALAAIGATRADLGLVARAALVVAGTLPAAVVVTVQVWAIVRARRVRYVLTRRPSGGGRGLLVRGGVVRPFVLESPRVDVDPGGEVGDIAMGDVSLRDVPYPGSVVTLVRELIPGT